MVFNSTWRHRASAVFARSSHAGQQLQFAKPQRPARPVLQLLLLPALRYACGGLLAADRSLLLSLPEPGAGCEVGFVSASLARHSAASSGLSDCS